MAVSLVGVRAYRDSVANPPNDTWTQVALNQERRDDNTYHDTVTNNERFTVQTTGWHVIAVNDYWSGHTTGGRAIRVTKNAGATVIYQVGHAATSSSADDSDTGAAIVYLTAGDYIVMEVWQNSGGALTLNSASAYTPEFSMLELPSVTATAPGGGGGKGKGGGKPPGTPGQPGGPGGQGPPGFPPGQGGNGPPGQDNALFGRYSGLRRKPYGE